MKGVTYMGIKVMSIGKIDTPEYGTYLTNDKEKVKYIKRIEMIIRSSNEYRDYIAFLKEYVDMTKCAFFNNVSNEQSRKIRIEIHHEPFTLFDIVQIVLSKWQAECIPLNDLLIADEVMSLHFRNCVGLIPLSKTVHETVHSNSNVVIPLYLIYGKYKEFLKEYEPYLEESMIDKLERKIALTKNIKENSFDIFNKEFEYLEIDGVTLPQRIKNESM